MAPKRPTSRAVIPSDRAPDGHRPGQERRPGLQGAEVAHVLEVEGAEEEGRVHGRDQEPTHDARADQPAQTQDAQGHDRVCHPGLEGQEGGHQHGGDRSEAEHLARAPAMAGGLHDRVDRGHQRAGDQDRAQPVHAAAEQCGVARDQQLPEHRGERADGQVDKEDPVPVDGLGERAAGQQAQRAAGYGDEHVGAHGPGAVSRRREFGDDDGQDDRGLHGGADALDEACGDEHALVGRDSAQGRGHGEQRDPAEKDALSPEQVTEAAGEQQEAAERDQEGVDDPGQIALGEVEITLDRGQRHVHDRRVEHDHELGQADDHEGQPAAAIRRDGE